MNSVQIIGLRGGFSFEEAVAHFTGMGGEVVLFDPSVVCGKDHILSAVRHAERAFRVGNNRAKNLLTETVLYAAGERQIGRALEKMKPKSSGGMVTAVFDIDDLALERLGAARDDSLCDA